MPPSPAGSRCGSPPRRAPRGRGRCRAWRRRASRASRISSTTTRRGSPRRARRWARRAAGSGSSATKTRATFTRCCSPPENVTGESAPEPLGNAQPLEHARGPAPRLLARRRRARAAGSATTSTRGHAGDHAQELAHVADGPPAQRRACVAARRPTMSTDRVPVPHEDPAGLRLVVAVDRSAAACSCPRPTGRRARRTRPAPTARLTPRSTGSRAPPCTCSMKVFSTPADGRARGAHGWQHRGRRGAGCRRCCGSSSTWSVSPDSTISPRRMTSSRWASRRATARSWVTTIGGQAELGHERPQQVEEPRLHRDVEAAGGLVHEHEPRPRHQVARDLQPLLHAAGEGLRQVVDAVAGAISTGSSQSTRRPRMRAVVALAQRHQPLAHVGARASRVMRSPSRGFWWTMPQSVRSSRRRAASGSRSTSTTRPSARRGTRRAPARGGTTRPARQASTRGLARARLADDAQHLARPEVEAHVEAADLRRRSACVRPRTQSSGRRRRSRRRRPRSRPRAARAVVGVRADEDPAALVVHDDLVEEHAARRRRARTAGPTARPRTGGPRSRGSAPGCTAAPRRSASRGRRRRAAAPGCGRAWGCRTWGSATAASGSARSPSTG